MTEEEREREGERGGLLLYIHNYMYIEYKPMYIQI